jgi:ribosomal protein L11 methyltransferase
MNWLSVTFEVNAEQAELLSDVLPQLGALSVDVSDAKAGTREEQTLFGEPGAAAAAWRASRVSGLFPADVDVARVVMAAADTVRLAQPKFTITDVPDQDWVRLVQSQFAPLQVSARLWVVPTWHTPSENEAIHIVLDPGLAFGTGSHPTTRLCLKWLDAHIQGGECVLDYGCGSGILALAAKKFGAQRVIGVDCDLQALDASRANARQNNIEAEFYAPDKLPPLKADVVMANILSNPLKLLAPLLAHAVRRRGAIVLSGILAAQAREVEAAYLEWFDMQQADQDSGWVCLAGIKR